MTSSSTSATYDELVAMSLTDEQVDLVVGLARRLVSMRDDNGRGNGDGRGSGFATMIKTGEQATAAAGGVWKMRR